MFGNFCKKSCCPVVSTECCPTDPVYENPIQNCIQKDYVHEVTHIVPIHTNVVNNHIYKHTYVPEYTCSEENVCTNINDTCPSFGNFMNN